MSETSTIDSSIQNLEEQIEEHSKAARNILMYVFVFASMILVMGFMLSTYERFQNETALNEMAKIAYEIQRKEGSVNSPFLADLNKAINSIGSSSNSTVSSFYVFAALFVVVFGVMMAIYRFHLSEISKAQHHKLGFMRIRVAANNSDKEGFLTEVRESLTHNAFEYSTGKDKKIKSPLPGHPTSDISTSLVNKLLSNVEVKIKNEPQKSA